MTTVDAAFLRAIVGAIFLSAATAKILSHSSLAPFLGAIGVPARTATGVSRAAPLVEGLLGIGLVLGLWAFPVAVAALLLSLAFCAVLTIARVRGVRESCRCFGALDDAGLSLVPIFRACLLGGATFAVCLTSMGTNHGTPLVLRFPQEMALGLAVGLGCVIASALLGQVWTFERSRPHLVPGSAAVAGTPSTVR